MLSSYDQAPQVPHDETTFMLFQSQFDVGILLPVRLFVLSPDYPINNKHQQSCFGFPWQPWYLWCVWCLFIMAFFLPPNSLLLIFSLNANWKIFMVIINHLLQLYFSALSYQYTSSCSHLLYKIACVCSVDSLVDGMIQYWILLHLWYFLGILSFIIFFLYGKSLVGVQLPSILTCVL